MIEAEVVSVELKRTKAGDLGINVVIKTIENEWVRDFIGIKAPSWVAERWWNLLGYDNGWEKFASQDAFDLCGLKILVELEPSEAWAGKVQQKVKSVKLKDGDSESAPSEESVSIQEQIEPDDLPF